MVNAKRRYQVSGNILRLEGAAAVTYAQQGLDIRRLNHIGFSEVDDLVLPLSMSGVYMQVRATTQSALPPSFDRRLTA